VSRRCHKARNIKFESLLFAHVSRKFHQKPQQLTTKAIRNQLCTAPLPPKRLIALFSAVNPNDEYGRAVCTAKSLLEVRRKGMRPFK
jgi:hypothetical protein